MLTHPKEVAWPPVIYAGITILPGFTPPPAH